MQSDGPQDRALIVDDNDDTSEMLAMLLRRIGYDVETASSAFAALDRFKEGATFCLVISDIGMPGMNGYELALKLRTLPECKSMVMVAVTGFSIYGDRGRAIAAGFDEVLVKPVGPRTLMATVDRLRKTRK